MFWASQQMQIQRLSLWTLSQGNLVILVFFSEVEQLFSGYPSVNNINPIKVFHRPPLKDIIVYLREKNWLATVNHLLDEKLPQTNWTSQQQVNYWWGGFMLKGHWKAKGYICTQDNPRQTFRYKNILAG